MYPDHQPLPAPLVPAARPPLDATRLDQLALTSTRLGAAVNVALEQAVTRSRAAGESWRAIGRDLGMSRQAARKRFGHCEPVWFSLVVAELPEGGRSACWVAETAGGARVELPVQPDVDAVDQSGAAPAITAGP